MPRAKLPYKLKQPQGEAQAVPLTAAVQAWLLVRGLHCGPHLLGRPSVIRYKTLQAPDSNMLSAQVLHQVMNSFNF